MFNFRNQKIWLYAEPIDFRKGMMGIMELVAADLDQDPGNGDLYLFRSKRADRLKLLFWQNDGFWLCYKKIEKKKFKFPAKRDEVFELTEEQLQWLISGLNFQKIVAVKPPDAYF